MSTFEYVPGVHVIVNASPGTGVPMYVKSLSATPIAAKVKTANNWYHLAISTLNGSARRSYSEGIWAPQKAGAYASSHFEVCCSWDSEMRSELSLFRGVVWHSKTREKRAPDQRMTEPHAIYLIQRAVKFSGVWKFKSHESSSVKPRFASVLSLVHQKAKILTLYILLNHFKIMQDTVSLVLLIYRHSHASNSVSYSFLDVTLKYKNK